MTLAPYTRGSAREPGMTAKYALLSTSGMTVRMGIDSALSLTARMAVAIASMHSAIERHARIWRASMIFMVAFRSRSQQILYDPATLHDQGNTHAVLEHTQVAQRIAVDGDQVRERTRCHD